jgi:hypothetical protein
MITRSDKGSLGVHLVYPDRQVFDFVIHVGCGFRDSTIDIGSKNLILLNNVVETVLKNRPDGQYIQ